MFAVFGRLSIIALRFRTLPADFADDAAAAAGGVVVGGVYRTGSVLKVRAA